MTINSNITYPKASDIPELRQRTDCRDRQGHVGRRRERVARGRYEARHHYHHLRILPLGIPRQERGPRRDILSPSAASR